MGIFGGIFRGGGRKLKLLAQKSDINFYVPANHRSAVERYSKDLDGYCRMLIQSKEQGFGDDDSGIIIRIEDTGRSVLYSAEMEFSKIALTKDDYGTRSYSIKTKFTVNGYEIVLVTICFFRNRYSTGTDRAKQFVDKVIEYAKMKSDKR